MGKKLINPLLEITNKRSDMINPYMVGGGGSDADAQAFLTAAGITDSTISSAINTLVLGLKTNNIWSKMKAIYPFVGGTATTHKFNLKDPRDLDAAFRLAFSGTWTHNANGITGNGSNTYADTKLIPNDSLTLDDTHMSIYSRTNTSGNYLDMGTISISNDARLTIYVNFYGFQVRLNSASLATSIVNSDSRGMFIISRLSSTSIFLKISNSDAVSKTPFHSTAKPLYPIFIGNINNDGTPWAGYYSNRNYAFASIGYRLSTTDAANLYTLVQAFQTSLGRQV